MRPIAVLATVLAGLALCACGGATGAPWCAHYSSGLNDCSFYSYEQCTNSLSGVGGTCSPNQFQRR
jgi:hypothetical protein